MLRLPPVWSAGAGAARMEIVDIQGKIVRTLSLAALEKTSVSLGGLPPGLYAASIYKVQNLTFPRKLSLTFMVTM